MTITDPIEIIIADALTKAAIGFVHSPTGGLDFLLPDFKIRIECKQFFSERIVRQLAGRDNVIVIQGRAAALAFAKLLER